MKRKISKITSVVLCFCLLLSHVVIVSNASETEYSAVSPILSAENISISEGMPYDLTSDASASSVMSMTDGTIIIHYS